MNQDFLIEFVMLGQRAQQAAEAVTPNDTGRFADARYPAGYPKTDPAEADGRMTTPRWFITFGNGTERRNKYALLQAQDYGDARREAFARFDRHWAFMYGIEDLAPQIASYGIEELSE